jgi:hypothetical protein
MLYEGGPFWEGLSSGADQYLARRGPAGWSTTSRSEELFGDGERQGFVAFSSDLSRGVLFQQTPALSPQAPAGYPNLYLWAEGEPLTPLNTVAPPSRDPGTNGFVPLFAGANAGAPAAPAFTHLVLQANDALTAAQAGLAPAAPAVGTGETNLYEWSGGQLRLLNVAPGNATAVKDAVIGSGRLLGGAVLNDFSHAISDDGNRIFWSRRSDGQSYVREGGTATTQIPDPGTFLTATADGSQVLLSNGHLYDLQAKTTRDLTEGQGGFQGILGAASDLSRIYFVDTAALTGPSVKNAGGEAAAEGAFNLYLDEGGVRSFIGRLLAPDNSLEGFSLGAWRATPSERLAQVSADGRYLAFMSKAPLTGYDNRIATGAGCAFGGGGATLLPCPEVFTYDAATGALACASCNPTGVRPLGKSNLSLLYRIDEATAQPVNLPAEGEGRVFFESEDALSLADQNGAIRDVYEYRPQGVGGCDRPEGCIELISSGTDSFDSQFVSSSPSGKDAFFTTRAALLPSDVDDFTDLYDARVGGGFEEGAVVPCEAEACKGPAADPPAQPAAASAAFSGPGNPPATRPCAKGKVRRRGRCVKPRKRHRKHSRHAKRHRGGPK